MRWVKFFQEMQKKRRAINPKTNGKQTPVVLVQWPGLRADYEGGEVSVSAISYCKQWGLKGPIRILIKGESVKH